MAARIGIAVLALLLALLAVEATLRVTHRDALRLELDERNLLYEHDPLLGWFPRPDTRQAFTGSQTIAVSHNHEGFRDRDHERAGGRPIVLVLGDSYVWGYDVEQDRRFTEHLQRARPDLDIYNMGVSGYGTDQELLLLGRVLERHRPALVIVVFSNINDPEDNSVAVSNGGYAKPYFEIVDGRLELRGVPVPESARLLWARHALLRHSFLARLLAAPQLEIPEPSTRLDLTLFLLLSMRERVQSAGALFLVALLGDSPPLMGALDRAGCPHVSLHQITVRDGLFNPETTFPSHGRHWNDEGHKRVAAALLPYLDRLLP